MVEVDVVAVISIISDRRLILGGAAIFAADSKNHINVTAGNMDRSPLII